MIPKKRFKRLKTSFVKIFLYAILILFIALIINFYFMLQVPKPYIIIFDNGPLYEIEREPIIIRFINYIVSFFTGDWGYTYLHGDPVNGILRSSFPRMIETMILPLVIGFSLGKLLKRVLLNHNRMRRTFKVFGMISIAIPIFLFGVYLQHIFIRILPVDKWEGHTAPLVTGFLILDSIIAGEWELVIQIAVYYIFPTLFLIILITIVTARKTITNPSQSTQNDSIFSNSLQTGIIFSLIFTYYILVDTSFLLRGFSFTLLTALLIPDFYLLQGCMFIIIILFVISIFLSNIIFTLKSPSKMDINKELKEKKTEKKAVTNLREQAAQLKKFFIIRLKSPVSLVGVSILIFLIIIVSFPHLITPYNLSDIIPPGFGYDPYAPPSKEHPLGTAHYGYDLLALVIWGMKDLLTSGGWIIVIGLLGGIPFGILASKYNRSDKLIVMSVMSLFFIFPGIVITMLMSIITDMDHSVEVFTIGILLIPFFARKVANTKPEFINTFKELIIYIPGVLFFVIFVYSTVSFFGFSSYSTPQLGYIVYRVYRMSTFLDKYWVVFWPGLAIGIINAGLVLLYLGFNPRNPKIR
ncbi:MAG: hypothetical protein ACFFFB_25265 [Candidatus Heimdallarchaeota archaeon]